MAVASNITDFLDNAQVEYEVISHEAAFTAQEVAAKTHISGKELAKAVILKADGKFIMAVLAAPDAVDVKKLASACGAKNVTLATEDEFKGLFPGSEPGAEPPLGRLYDIPVHVDLHLALDAEITFNAGTHTDVIRMRFGDFERVTAPMVEDISKDVG